MNNDIERLINQLHIARRDVLGASGRSDHEAAAQTYRDTADDLERIAVTLRSVADEIDS